MRNTNPKRLLSLLLTLLMIVSMFPASAFADVDTETEDAVVYSAAETSGVTQAATVDELTNAAKKGGTVQLTADINAVELSGVSFTLDLNGHSLQDSSAAISISQNSSNSEYSNVTIIGTGKIESTGNNAIVVGPGCSLTINGDVTVTGGTDTFGILIDTDASAAISEGKFSGSSGSISNSGTCAITGGCFSDKPTPADGYMVVNSGINDYQYKVVKAVAQIGSTKYADLHEALVAGKAAGTTVTLLSDVTLTGNWTPVADFNGTFDGAGKTITGLNVNGESSLGLFASTSTSATIKDLTISGANITGTGSNVGVLAGSISGSVIDNVTITGSTVTATGGQYTGGLCGSGYPAASNCTITSNTINGADQVGGMIGYMWVGHVENCTVTGNTVTATSERAGGLAGKIQISSGNLGSSTMWFNGNTVSGTVSAPDYTGGIAAQIMGNVNYYSIKNNSIDTTLTAPETNPIGNLRDGQNADFTGALATNITGNSWTKATYAENSFTYTNVHSDVTDAQTITNADPFGDYEIRTAEELVAFQIDITADTTKKYAGKTVVIKADIDLAGYSWTPITCHNEGVTIDGQGHTISNMTVAVTGDVAAGFIGDGTSVNVVNLNFDKASVTGNHWAGVVVGYGQCAEIDKCTVTDSTVATSAMAVTDGYDNGDKAGAICGYLINDGGGGVLTNCVVDNCTVTGYRDIGGLLGYANTDSTVTDNTVENTTVVNDQSQNYKSYAEDSEFDVNEIIGETSSRATVNNNTATNVTVVFPSKNFVQEDGVWHIKNLDGLKEFRDQANAGTLNGTNGGTHTKVVLDADIDLENVAWTPINGSCIDFDGQNHTISNVYVNTTDKNVGLFGTFSICRIENLTVDGANVTGINHVAALCGDGLCTHIVNCTVKNAVVTTNVYNRDDGDKAGAICGYLSGESDAEVTNCTVDNCTVRGYRDIGGLVGYANGTATVTGNTVTNTTVINDQENNYKNYTTDADFDANTVVGEAVSNATVSNNTAGDDVVVIIANKKVVVDDEGSKKASVDEQTQTSKVTVDTEAAENLKEFAEDSNTTTNTKVTGVKLSDVPTVEVEDSDEISGLQAVVDAAKADAEKDNNTEFTEAIKAEATNKEVTIRVEVTVTPTEYEAATSATSGDGKIAFELTPTATVTVTNTDSDGKTTSTATQTGVKVTNDMIDQSKKIAVSIYTGFKPAQIVHADDDGSVIDVFNENDIIYDSTKGVATVYVSHFSKLYVSQATNVATDGTTTYATLAEAVEAAAESGDTITLLESVDVSTSGLTISGKSITLDLNGYNVKAGEQATNNITVASDAALTLKDSSSGASGKIYTEENWTSSANGYGVVRVAGTFVMESGNIEAVMDDVSNNGQFGIVETSGAKVTIKGGQVKAGWHAITNNASTDGATTDIEGGTLISTGDYAIYNPGKNSSVTVSGGTVYGEAGGIAMYQGTLNITGGTVTSKGQGNTGTWGDGTGNLSNAAVYVGTDRSGYGNVTATISGGTITAEGNAVTLNSANTDYTVSLSVSGGTFSSAVAAEYCAAGFEPKDNGDGTYGVETVKVAQIGDVEYTTLAAAIAACTDEVATEIDLIADINYTSSDFTATSGEAPCNSPIEIPAGKVITLDLNGRNITATGADPVLNNGEALLVNEGTLTIKDSVGTGSMIYTAQATSGYNYITDTISNMGVLTVESGSIVNKSAVADINYAIDSHTYKDADTVSLTITGGTISAPNCDAAVRYFVNYAKTCNLTISGGTISGGNGCEGALFIQDSSNEGTGETKNYSTGSIVISDGEFITDKNAISVKIGSGVNSKNISFSITGGKFNAATALLKLDNNTTGQNIPTPVITGGYFTEAENESATTYLASGYEIVANTDESTKTTYPYTVQEAPRTIKVSTTQELQDALDSAKKGDTIVVAEGNYETVYLRNNGTDANRIMENVTIVAAENATVNIEQIASAVTNTKFLDIENLVIDGLTFSNVEKTGILLDYNYTDSKGQLRVNGLTVQNCSKTGDNRTSDEGGYNKCDFVSFCCDSTTTQTPYAGDASLNCGYHGITIKNNTITNVYCPIFFQNNGLKSNLTVTGNTFTGCTFNQIGVNGDNISGTNTITNNIIVGQEGRFVRISGATEDATFIITGNTVTNPSIFEDEYGTDIVKITGTAGFTVTDSDNTWNAGDFTSDAKTTWISNGTPVAKIGTKNFGTLQAAFDAAVDGDTITVVANITPSDIVKVAGKTITIDLAGKTISRDIAQASTNAYGTASSQPVIWVGNGANLTMTDSVGGGIVKTTSTYGTPINVGKYDGGSSDDKVSTVTLNGGSYYGGYSCGYIFYNGHYVVNEGVTINCDESIAKGGNGSGIQTRSPGAQLTVNGGTLESQYGIGGNGNGDGDETSITINGGTINVTKGCGIYHQQDGVLTITGGTITGSDSAVEMRAGTINVTGGTLTATATEYSCDPDESGSTTVGAALAIAQHATKVDIAANITGGTFIGVKAISESNPQENDPAPQVTMSVTGGQFKGDITIADTSKFISGGVYSVSPDSAYLAEGKAVIANTDSATKAVYPFGIGTKTKDVVIKTDEEGDPTVTVDVDTTVDYSVHVETAEGLEIPETVQTEIQNKTYVEGVELEPDETVTSGTEQVNGVQAVVNAAKAQAVTDKNTAFTKAVEASTTTNTTVTVKVDVQVTPVEYDEEDQTIKFDLTPYATVSIRNGDSATVKQTVEVTNEMIDTDKDITITLYTGFEPAYLVHRGDDGSLIDNYYPDETADNKTFSYDSTTGVCTVVVNHFSTVEAVEAGNAPTVVATITVNEVTSNYESLQAAVTAVKDGEIIVITDDNTETLTVDEEKEFTIRGGKFSAPTADDAYTVSVNTENGLVTVKEVKYTVTVTSRALSTNNTVAAVSGGGNIGAATGTTISAPDVYGYTFEGWYTGYTTEETGNLFTYDQMYTFKPTADIDLFAVYSVDSDVKLSLTVDASRFKITGKSATQKGYQTYSFTSNTEVTVTYTDSSYNFLYWANGNDKVMSRNEDYTFVLGSNTNLHAVYAESVAGTESLVIFVSLTDQVMGAETYTLTDTIEFPKVPTSTGKIFTKWIIDGTQTEATEANIRAAMAENSVIRVVPEYIDDGNTYNITIKYMHGDEEESMPGYKEIASGVSQEILADAKYDDAKFSYWFDGTNILTYNRYHLVFSATEDVNLTAVYGVDVDAVGLSTITSVTGREEGQYYKLSFTETFSIPSKCTMVSTGFVRTLDQDVATEEKLILDGDSTYRYESELSNTYGVYTQHLTIGTPDKTVWMRGYVQYRDADDVLHTVYSDIKSCSYNSLGE